MCIIGSALEQRLQLFIKLGEGDAGDNDDGRGEL